MTEKERYDVLLAELAEKLKEKNDKILMQSYEISSLKAKLEEAEIILFNENDKKLEIR